MPFDVVIVFIAITLHCLFSLIRSLIAIAVFLHFFCFAPFGSCCCCSSPSSFVVSVDTACNHVCTLVEKRGRNFKWWRVVLFGSSLFIHCPPRNRWYCALKINEEPNSIHLLLLLAMLRYLFTWWFFFSTLFQLVFFSNFCKYSCADVACLFRFLHLIWWTHYLCDNVWWWNLHMTVTVDILPVLRIHNHSKLWDRTRKMGGERERKNELASKTTAKGM